MVPPVNEGDAAAGAGPEARGRESYIRSSSRPNESADAGEGSERARIRRSASSRAAVGARTRRTGAPR